MKHTFVHFLLFITIGTLSGCNGDHQFGLCVNEVVAVQKHQIEIQDLGEHGHIFDEINAFGDLQMLRYSHFSFVPYQDLSCIQFFKGLPIINHEVRVTYFNGKFSKLENYFDNIELDTEPSFTRDIAAGIAHDSINSRSCYFVELGIWATSEASTPEGNFKLVYEVRTKYEGAMISIDAHSGEVLSFWDGTFR